MGGARRKGLTADYGDASPEDVARALHGHRPQRERTPDERVARLLEHKLVWPDELDDPSAEELEVADVPLDHFGNLSRRRVVGGAKFD